MLAGKLCALVPIVIALIVGGWYAGIRIWTERGAVARSAASRSPPVCVAASLVAAGIATVVPKHGMALTIGYMLVDLFIGEPSRRRRSTNLDRLVTSARADRQPVSRDGGDPRADGRDRLAVIAAVLGSGSGCGGSGAVRGVTSELERGGEVVVARLGDARADQRAGSTWPSAR